MDPISQVNPVLDALRKQLAENIERLRKAGKLAASPRAEQRAALSATDAEGLEATLKRRLSALDCRTAEGLSAATRVFVEATLVAEFGAALISDPAFGVMVAEISDSLRQDAETRAHLDTLLAGL